MKVYLLSLHTCLYTWLIIWFIIILKCRLKNWTRIYVQIPIVHLDAAHSSYIA
jgi:hypothetical protein